MKYQLIERDGLLAPVEEGWHLLHLISSEGFLNTEITRRFLHKYPNLSLLRKRGDVYQTGSCVLIDHILNLVVKESPRERMNYQTLWQSINATKEICQFYQINKLSMPMIDYRDEGMEWERIEKLFTLAFRDMPIHLVVCINRKNM